MFAILKKNGHQERTVQHAFCNWDFGDVMHVNGTHTELQGKKASNETSIFTNNLSKLSSFSDMNYAVSRLWILIIQYQICASFLYQEWKRTNPSHLSVGCSVKCGPVTIWWAFIAQDLNMSIAILPLKTSCLISRTWTFNACRAMPQG